jgi:hypothetical protein
VAKTRHTPPLPQDFATHVPPVQDSVASQTSHVPPTAPQAELFSPVWQEPSAAQHPPGQGFAAVQTVQISLAQMGALAGHDATHAPVLALQQVLAGQSPGLAVHAAHWPLTHTGSLPAQSSLSQHSWQTPVQQILPPPQVLPFASVVQVPALLQAWHAPSQALSQQTSSTQNPEAHCPSWAQASPFG